MNTWLWFSATITAPEYRNEFSCVLVGGNVVKAKMWF